MFARTDRLLLRPGWIEDAPALAQAMNDEAVARNLARVPWPYSLRDAEAFLSDEQSALPRFCIFLRTLGAPRLIGGIGLHEGEDGSVELGYWIARRCWGLGYATEAGRAVVDLAHNGLRIRRLTSGHLVDNPSSGRVLRKLGFRPTGAVVRRHSLARGREEACVLFERLADAAAELPMPALAA
jgi:RimJ/RimL family protein N-acetyltransferase